MEKLVKKIRNKFFANEAINIVDMNLPECNGSKSSILDILDKDVDKKYILKTNHVIKKIYEESVLKNSNKVSTRIRRENCENCEKVTSFEVLDINTTKKEVTIDRMCLECNKSKITTFQKEKQ